MGMPRLAPLSLQRRLLLIVALGTPLVWLVALGVSLYGGDQEINELFDTQQVRLAQLVGSIVSASGDGVAVPSLRLVDPGGSAELEDIAIAVWSRSGAPRWVEQTGIDMPFRPGFSGFTDLAEGGGWRLYYLEVPQADAVVAVGQRSHERAELLRDILLAQLAPWMAMLVLLIIVLSAGIRRVMTPVVSLARAIENRRSDDLRPLPTTDLPAELLPLAIALNRLLVRIVEAMEHERRFTADAAHELRTPLAATRAQWEVACRATDPQARAAAARHVDAGLMRMSGLVSQLLALARIDSVDAAAFQCPIDWTQVVEQAVRDTLPLADERGIEIAVEWLDEKPLPLVGQPELVASALRNLVDNAVRYAPVGSVVTVRCASDRVGVHDQGPGVPDDVLARLGERFFRHAGQQTLGSGLGLSIVGRIAQLHSLSLVLQNEPGGGFSAWLGRGQMPPGRMPPGQGVAAARSATGPSPADPSLRVDGLRRPPPDPDAAAP